MISRAITSALCRMSVVNVHVNIYEAECVGYSPEDTILGDPKKLAHFVLYPLTSSNIDRFSNLFHCQNQENICNNAIVKDRTTCQVCRYTTL